MRLWLSSGLLLALAVAGLGQEITSLSPIPKGQKVSLPKASDRFYSEWTIDRNARSQGQRVIELGIVTDCKELRFALVGGKWITNLRVYIRIKGFSQDAINVDGHYWDLVQVERSAEDLQGVKRCKPVAINRRFALAKGLYRADLRLLDDQNRSSLVLVPFKVEE
jgi:hypothetical protein